jgi:hypothetical protein
MNYKNLLFGLLIISNIGYCQDNQIDLNQNGELTTNGNIIPSPNEQKYNNQILLNVPYSNNNHSNTTTIELSPNVQNICSSKTATKININYQLEKPGYHYDLKSKELYKIGKDSDVMGLYKGNQNLNIQPIITILKNNVGQEMCSYVSEVTINVFYTPQIYVANEATKFQCTFNRVLRHENTHYAIELNAIKKLKPQIEQMVNQMFSQNLVSTDEKSLETEIKNRFYLLKYNYDKLFSENTLPYHRQLDNTENYLKEQHECSDEENKELTDMANQE